MALKFPTIYLLPKGLDPGRMSELESQIPSLTYDINEADVVLGKVSHPQRAKLELQIRNIVTEDLLPSLPPDSADVNSGPPAKRRKVSESTTHAVGPSIAPESETATDASVTPSSLLSGNLTHINETTDPKTTVKVVKLDWFLVCLGKNTVLPLDDYLVYQGRKVSSLVVPVSAPPKVSACDILERAREEGRVQKPESKWALKNGYASHSQHSRTHTHLPRPRLKHESTSEHDRAMRMPPIPDFLHTTYSCERPTPANPPNAAFIEQLKEIRTIRTLTDDKEGERAYGVRAYSTAISTLAAYPYPISCVPEIERLPGCSTKIAGLWDEWRENGFIQEVEDAKTDENLSVLKLFYDIWGVAATTAREFYNKGWRDIDDIVEYGWNSLTRVQQIGVKFYDEFKLKIPRAEVESIAQTILDHANKIHEGFHMVIVGGYRRGRSGSGDVDVVLSHPNPDYTLNFVHDIVASLEDSQYITHTLTLSTKNSERGQTPVAWKGEGRKAGTGFDTLDKALLVWQEPAWDPSSASASQKQKNPNPHRRVDIIISPWKTAGCAVLGWSGATTFQRDLRRYCKEKKQLKFDSSGIRSRTDGRWVDVESDLDGPAPDLLTAEKRVFASLGLEWRPPEERCTDG
ncbi:hypothetical protein DL768_005556 [Monosporascus sp. mg162]|nr:hypothetical protein DL768_005556 [Monosporascus sp. mg162]